MLDYSAYPHNKGGHEETLSRNILSAALSVSPVLGLSEEELEAVLTAMVFGVPDPTPLLIKSAEGKLKAALAAFREEGSVSGG